MHLTFRTKLLASHIGLVAVVVSIVVFKLYIALDADLREQLDERLEQQAFGAAQWAMIDGGNPERLAIRLAAVVGAQVTIFGKHGEVLSDSDPGGVRVVTSEDEGSQSEVVEALSDRVGHATRPRPGSSTNMRYVAVQASDGLVVRLGVPLSGIDAILALIQHRMWVASGIALGAALALGSLASRIAARPLRVMTQAAGRIARGDYAIGIVSSSPDEFGMLSRSLASLAAQLEERIGDLVAERDRLSAILAGMVEGVVVTDARGQIIVANPAAEQILGASESLVGSGLQEADISPRLRAMLAEVTRSGEVTPRGDEQLAEMRTSEVGGRLLDVYVRPLAPKAGGGVVAVLRDMTQIRRLETMRRDFVANASHELRTPVTAIQGYAETILRGTVDDKTAREFLEIIHRHARRLGALLADLLWLSELEARPPSLVVREPAPVGMIAEHVVQTLRERMEEARATVLVEVEPDVLALGDPAGLEQVIQNLVDNALKYGKQGGLVRITGKRAGDRVHLSVIDDGPGIDAPHLPRIFERFYRVDPGRSRERGGTGLGLAIVKHLVESMGGSVEVKSQVGKGCSFEVDLPAAR